MTEATGASWGVDDLTVHFGKVKALRRVSFEMEPGVVHAIVGGDGAGKTTLLRVVAGLGLDIDGIVRIPGAGRIGYVPPNGGVFGDLSVSENVEFTADAYGLREWRGRGAELLGRAGLDQFGDRLASKLSGGQRRKLAGSMALLPQPDLLVLDEVTTGVDPVSRMDLWRLVASAAADGAAVVIATSYLDEAERSGQVLLLHDGQQLAVGSPRSIVAGMQGTVTDVSSPDGHRSWRRGRRWRQWNPDGTDGGEVTLEDVAIVAELRAEEGTQ